MKCPACKETNLVMSDRQGVEIDYCPDCRGVWLDRGELDKIIERSESNTSQPVSTPRYKEQYRDTHRSSHHKKRKSFLSELFD